MKALTEQELHNLAMNIVGRHLEDVGYEFLAVNSTLKKNPQFVCLKGKSLHFVVVKEIAYPADPLDIDLFMPDLYAMKDHATKFGATTYYAPVGLVNAANRNLPVYLNEEYIVDFSGLIEI